jgi:hypothetical protein
MSGPPPKASTTADGYKRLQTATNGYKRLQTAANGCKRLQTATNVVEEHHSMRHMDDRCFNSI